MPINSAVDEIQYKDNNVIKTVQNVSSDITQSIGTERLEYDNNFAGIDSRGLLQFSTAVGAYYDDINNILQQLNSKEEDIRAVIKGDKLVPHINDFFKKMKELLSVYLSSIEQEINGFRAASENWQRSTTKIGQDVHSVAQDIEDAANQIRSQAEGLTAEEG